ncbi:SusD/RagB family nutrient-binding outer membrane lipoprotein [Flavobacterium fluviatile]|uniref:SusD/RagB family nutrient-binding outer membrane lipoprotein n=1 Tax=Flavobacterium fluviatile TaxID=1862387 RepID=UPI0013D37457|nr:SusD/RagB family nutrient-binding outer membrane lipoprotein [Flavobacterium fluviatile]
MKKIAIVAVILTLLFINNACTGDFEELNENPNLIAEISPGTLLNPILYGMTSHHAQRSTDVTFNLMQVSLPFPSVSGGLHRYDVSPNIGNSSWNTSYRWLAGVREMRTAAEKAGDANYEAIALTLNAWIYANLTDIFGPVPMTEAVQGENGVLYPAYDTQQFIYETLLTDLEKANSLYDVKAGMIYASDILFQNDVAKWQKFTNSLHMRLLLRISNRSETNALQKLVSIVQNPAQYPVFTNTAESAMLQVTGVGANVSPWGRPQDFNNAIKMASFFIDNLNTFNDPRRAVMATTATDFKGVNLGYKGIPSAYTGSDSQFQYNASTLNRNQAEAPMKIMILTYAEVCFIKAELAQRGLINDPETHYMNGVKAAIEQVGAVTPADYFSNPAVAYDGSLEKIMLQKYYALYFTDYQQWFEYRRTGFPKLPTTSAMLNNAVMPARFTYPTDQLLYNAENYQEAVQMLGNDDINTKVWWDTID